MARSRSTVGIVTHQFEYHTTIKVRGRCFQVPRGEIVVDARNMLHLHKSAPITHVFPKEKVRKPDRVKISAAFMKRLRKHPDY
jgi:hypothetical protein